MPECVRDAELRLNPSNFVSHSVTRDVSETNYSFRFLKMQDSSFIYIGVQGSERFDELGVALPVRDSTEIVATTAIGPQLGCDSQELALKLAKRFKKQIYVSCNVPVDRLLRPLLERTLTDIIKENPLYV